MRGWGANLDGIYKFKKKNLLDQIKSLDSVVEAKGLSIDGWKHRYHLESELEKVYELEENH